MKSNAITGTSDLPAFSEGIGTTLGEYITIEHPEKMSSFLMSIVGNSDYWLFAGSNGTLTAGRRNPDHALFPYETSDKLLRFPVSAGSCTCFLTETVDGSMCWEPWRETMLPSTIERKLRKDTLGTSVRFEETNKSLNLTFSWEWTTCDEYGLLRFCSLKNTGSGPASVRMLDGLHRMLPPGLDVQMHARLSYLAQGYMRHEQLPGVPMALYTLNAAVSDKAEPSEMLRASTAGCVGLTPHGILLSSRQYDRFRKGGEVQNEAEIRGDFGAFLVEERLTLEPGETREWAFFADTDIDHARAAVLLKRLRDDKDLRSNLIQAARHNREGFRRRIASADGLQQSADRAACTHHFANVTFNCMRGGTFDNHYFFPKQDWLRFLRSSNRPTASRHESSISELPEQLMLLDLLAWADTQNDPQLSRLAREYLPLTFSRRHGDPSRPWNYFDIKLKDDQGRPIFNYQGNWRDIFQNWESLAISFPGFLENMITVFLNASSADGYNPYRITRDGFEWEAPEPDDPWANIGYWGDHQIIYLLRLLESRHRHEPEALGKSLNHRLYASARIPYRIASFADICSDPRSTITFDHELHEQLTRTAEELGADGKRERGNDGQVLLTSLADKLLLPLLVKLTNLVPGGGIWLNTQRPEWNDANNALAGYGLSVVTVCYMRRYVAFLERILAEGNDDIYLSERVAQLAEDISGILASADAENAASNPADRYSLMEQLGTSGERHRNAVYEQKGTAHRLVKRRELLNLLQSALRHLEVTVRANKRDDAMYHSYNLLRLDSREAHVSYLYPMLEGQVASLSSGLLTPGEARDLLRDLRDSELYREDQNSYLLYPDRKLRPFLERNSLPADARKGVPLISRLLDTGDVSLIVEDINGSIHFCGDLQTAGDIRRVLERLMLNDDLRPLVDNCRDRIFALWEQVFQHSSFTGRSGTFFAFEGLGSIYWHMVSKLLLAVQENFLTAEASQRDALATAYDDIRNGLGFTMSPEQYGAFPTDPYSHTPRHTGAQQPGMTGQVKEEIITRFGELGVVVNNGVVCFDPQLLKKCEFSDNPHRFEYVSRDGEPRNWELPGQTLAFTYCQTPIAYRLGEKQQITLLDEDGNERVTAGGTMDMQDSRTIFHRQSGISRVMVDIPQDRLR
ncbi:MAG: hypothetical protein KJ626_01650 [Verrucomicrobia bacterium]|nr:hypothetical protein [Verrucomicrobiota bacterium]